MTGKDACPTLQNVENLWGPANAPLAGIAKTPQFGSSPTKTPSSRTRTWLREVRSA